jgi:hypothetical protein
MVRAVIRADAFDMSDQREVSGKWRRVGASLGAVAFATLVIGLAACGGDDGDESTAKAAANGTPRSGAVDLDRFLMQGGEEPGFRRGAAPGATPSSGGTITGVRAFVEDMHLPQADARRLRREGFISFTVAPIRGPGTAGITNVALYETAEGAKHSLAHELRPNVIALQPLEDLRFFEVPGVPGARGWTASVPGGPAVGNVYWAQGRCMLVLGNQGPGPFVGPLSRGARAIYDRTSRQCPCAKQTRS